MKHILYLTGLSTFVVVMWVASSVYYALITPTVPEDTNKYSTPIDKSFDDKTLQKLSGRVKVPIDLSSQGSYVNKPSEENEASESAQLTPTPTRISPRISPEPIRESSSSASEELAPSPSEEGSL